jgi:hypothetical protein
MLIKIKVCCYIRKKWYFINGYKKPSSIGETRLSSILVWRPFMFSELLTMQSNNITEQKEKKSVGKKAKYGTPQEMQKKIDEYFSKYENRAPLTDKNGRVLLDKEGNVVYNQGMPTSSGLALFLGFTSRTSLFDYIQKPTFTDVIKHARLRLQSFWEPLLASKNYQGAKYFCSNMSDGWQEPEALAKQQLQQAPVVAQVVFITGKEKATQTAELPVIEADIIPAGYIAKPTRSKQANKPKAKARAKAKSK